MLSKKKEKKPLDDTADDIYNDDIVFEEGGSQEEKIKELRAKLNACLKENREYLSGWQRARADFVNAKRESEEKIKTSSEIAKSALMEELLPVIDSFEMAFANKESWEKVDPNWRTGVEYIYSQFLTTLEQNGLKRIDHQGETFDPRLHIPIGVEETEKEDENEKVVEILQKGYELNGRVLRPAKVKVAQIRRS